MGETGVNGRTQLEFIIPARGLLGFRGDFIRLSRGDGIMNHSFLDYRPASGNLEINVCKTKQLTNHRASGGEELVQLQTPQEMNLERALEYIGPDELVEVTPESIRLRKVKTKKLAKK